MNKIIFPINLKNIAITILIAIFFIGDRLLKSLALYLPDKSISLIGDWLNFYFLPNYNIAFSLPIGGQILNILIALILIFILLLLIFFSRKKTEIFIIYGLICLFLGAVSNFYDRLTHGYVIDYLSLKYFTIFNLADVLISIGAILLLIKINKKSI